MVIKFEVSSTFSVDTAVGSRRLVLLVLPAIERLFRIVRRSSHNPAIPELCFLGPLAAATAARNPKAKQTKARAMSILLERCYAEQC